MGAGSDDSGTNEVPLVATMLSSAAAGLLARLPLHPLDTIKAKMQVQLAEGEASKIPLRQSVQQIRSQLRQPSTLWRGMGESLPARNYAGFADVLATTLRVEGVRGLFSGIGITALGSAPAACLYFSAYEVSKRVLAPLSSAGVPTFAQHFASGLAAEAVSCVFWVPIDVIKERLQTQRSVRKLPAHMHYGGSWDALRQVARIEGLRGIYRGYGATVASFGPFSACYLSFYEQSKLLCERFFGKDSLRLASVNFVCGCASGCLASAVTNPIDMAKLRIQVQRRARAQKMEENPFGYHYRHVLHGMSEIVRQEGVAALFKGVTARMAFQGPGAGLTLCLLEQIRYLLLSWRAVDSHRQR
ncbi:MAG: hypothetical protein MHM6MM_006885 [Cercozoa sp. M6MM]